MPVQLCIQDNFQSTGIAIDAYSTNWYDSPVPVQKNLLLMILRSQRPLTLSAASMGVMSLEAYLGVGKIFNNYDNVNFVLLTNK